MFGINKDDFDWVANENHELHDEIKLIESWYKFTGLKYDFNVYIAPSKGSHANSPWWSNKTVSSDTRTKSGNRGFSMLTLNLN